MPGFIGNYKLPSTGGTEKVYSSLGCKLVTSFESNADRDPPLPAIMATITLMNPETGRLEALVEGTEITTWRTAAASLVATKYLYFNRPSIKSSADGRVLSIVGCGVQGEIHSIAFASYFEQIKEIRVYNRTHSKRDALYEKLMSMRSSFKNPNLVIIKSDDALDCVREADIIVTATRSSAPMMKKEDLKRDVHINGEMIKTYLLFFYCNKSMPLSFSAIGAGQHHHNELHPDIYASCLLYPDNWESAKTELAGIFDKITGIVGEVMLGIKPQPVDGISVFQSMGMAVEDVVVAQMVLEKHKKLR